MSNLSVRGEQSSDDEISALDSLAALAISGASQAIRKTGVTSFANVDIISNITGLISAGTNITLTGSGTAGSPYVIASSGGGGSGTVGPGTINEIAYFDTANTVASLTVATYPSLTELSYVKGVTSAIQTQLNGKQASLTFGIADTNSLRVDDAAAADNDYAKFTVNGLEGVPYSTVLSDIGAQPSDTTLTTLSALADAAGALTNNGAGVLSWSAVGVGDMILNGIQSVTGLKTFDKDKLAMKGTSTGVTTISTANAGATSYTATLQAADGTLAYLTDIPAVTNFATKALDNLASVAINTTLVSDTDNTDALGTTAIAWSDLFLGNGAVITFNSAPSTADVTITHSANLLTLAGGDLALGANNLTMTGSLAATGARVTKGWFTDVESTNMFTVGGVSLASTFSPIAGSASIVTVGTISTGVWQGTTIKANYLQQAAADLGDLDITVDLSNSNVGNVTNLTIDGTFQALSIGVTGTRIANGFFTDLTVTNAIAGSVTGSAATVTGAAQGAITSLGTLTTLTVDDITINGNTISSAGASTLAITPTAGQSITFDGTVTLDAGVVAGMTSLTMSGNIIMGVNSITMTGSLAATGARVTKGWFTDIESTNMPTVGGTAILTSLTAPNFTTIELGAGQTDTTLSRVSAGVVAIEGVNILTTAGGTLTGSITFGENTSLIHDNALSADGKYTGEVIAGTAGATLAFGDLIYLDPTDSRWELADANAASAADGDARGILGICVLAAAGDGNATTILLRGFVRADTAFPTLTVNAPSYVSETAGDITETQPTTADVVIRVVGFGFDANTLYFCPSSDYITHT